MRLLLLPLFLCGCELIVHFDPPPETGAQCDDGKDNDNDGKIDCDDDGCAAFAACLGPRCGDGKLDLPNPRLAAPVEVPVAAQAVAAGDLDGDGRADLLVAQGGSVTILHNTGTGFQPGTPLAVGGTLVALAIGDLDGDGDLDAVAVDTAGNQVFPLINARGTLTPGTPVTVGLSPRGIVLFDFDHDGDLDAVVADGVDFDGGTTLENSGGTLIRRALLDDAGPVAAVGVADLDGDHSPDIVAAFPGNDEVRAYRNIDSGFFGFNSSATAGTMPTSLAVLDINGDHRPDVVTGSANAGALSLLVTDAQGILGAGISLAVPNATSVTGLAAADFDRDGIDDLVVATGNRLVLFVGNGSSGFAAGAEVTAMANVGAPIAFFADGDVRTDVAAPLSTGAVAVALGNGEECDDGNRVGGDACLPDCTLPATPLFARQLGGLQADLATDVAVDDADNVYVVGSFQGDLDIGGAPPITSQGGTDFFVASFTPDGTLRWRAAFGGQMEDTALGVAVDPHSETLVVVGQAGPSIYGETSIQFDQQAFALTMSSLDGTPLFVRTFTDRSSTGRASSVAFGRDGNVLVGGRFDGTLAIGAAPIVGPGGFVADVQGGFKPFTGNPNNEVVRLRADGPNVVGLLVFGGRVPELSLNSDGGRDLALLTIQPDNVLGRVDQLGGGGDVSPGDLAGCRPHALWLVTGFSGDFSVGGLTAQGTSDIATVRVDLDGNLTGTAVAGPGAETAFSAVCDARQNLLIGGSLTLFDRTNAIGSFALDGSPIWGLPSVLSPLGMARDSRGFVYVAGGINAALSWGPSNFTPFGSSDGVLAKFRP